MSHRKIARILGRGVAVALLILAVRPSAGFDRYRSPTGGDCAGCHGNFNAGFSPGGTIFPFGSNHLMHRASGAMNTACDMCHSDGDDLNPFIAHSDADGFGGGPGVGCLGCHGREYEGRGALGVGLREVHRRTVSSCGSGSCHADDPDPLPEDVLPPYYGSLETRVWDSCNVAPFYGENFSLDPDNRRGLDNDGDGRYDEDDDACGCRLDLNGDGIIGFADVLAVLSTWGPCAECDEDVDRNGEVGFGDVLLLLGNWGICP